MDTCDNDISTVVVYRKQMPVLTGRHCAELIDHVTIMTRVPVRGPDGNDRGG